MLTIRSKSCLMNLMKFWHVESQKPARDERRWVIGMADLVFNINYVAVHFDIYKTIAFRINNRFVQKKTWLETARDRGGGGRTKTNSIGRTFHQDIPYSNSICATSRNSQSLVHEYPPKASGTRRMIKILTFCHFENILWQTLSSIEMTFATIHEVFVHLLCTWSIQTYSTDQSKV